MGAEPRPESVRRDSLARVVSALEEHGGLVRIRGDRLQATCPAHEDSTPSLTADWRDLRRAAGGTGVVLVCQAGCDTADVLAALGLAYSDLYDDPPTAPAGAIPRNRPRPPVTRPRRPSTPPAKKSTPASAAEPRRRKVVVAQYDYTDEHGVFLGRKLRYDPKGFAWSTRDDRGRWSWRGPDRTPLYRLPEVLEVAGAGGLVYVVEGEKDADAAVAAGAIGTCSPHGATRRPEDDASRKWQPEHTDALRGARVVVVADRDEAGYAFAGYIARQLAGVAVAVEVLQASAGKDLSDHLAAGRTLADLIPVPAVLLDPAPAPHPGEGDRLSAPVLDHPTRHRLAGDPAGPGGGGPGGPGGPGGTGGGGADDEDQPAVQRDVFAVVDDSLVKVAWVKRGDEFVKTAREVLNCRVRLARRVRLDQGDGARARVTHVDLVAERDGETAELPDVRWEDFLSLAWVGDLPWEAQVRRTHQGRSDVVNAILATSGPVEVISEHYSLGWQELPAHGWVFVHAGGAIGAAGVVPGVRVDGDLPAELEMYALPEPPVPGSSELAAAVAASLAVFDRLPARIAAPLLGLAYRAPLGYCRHTVMPLGSPGGGKTSVSALALQHHAPAARHDWIPTGAGEAAGTATGLEDLRYRCGDMILLADDLAPDRGPERAAARANEIIRGQYNRLGKVRGKREGGLRRTHRPRSALLLTGEDGASSASAEQRVLYVPIRRGDLPLPDLIELSTDQLATARAAFTAAYVQHLAGRRAELETWCQTVQADYASQLRNPDADDPGADARRAEAAASLAAGWRAMLDAARAWGVLDDDQAADYWARAWAGLVEASRAQADAVEDRGLPARAADALRAAIVSGRVYIAGREGGTPVLASDTAALRRWGWEPITMMGQVADPRPAGAALAGWTEGDRLWLEPTAAFAGMEAMARAASDPLGVTPRALAAALRDAELLTVEPGTDGNRRGVRRPVGGARRRVWELPVSWLYEDGDQADADPPTLPEPPALDRLPIAPPDPPAGDPASRTDQPAEPLSGPQPAQPADPGPTTPEANTMPTATPRRPDPSSPYRAPLVVCDEWIVWFPDGEAETLPEDCDDLPALLEWAESLQLGHRPSRGRGEQPGQVWILPALAARLGLPDRLPKSTRSSRAGDQRAAAADQLAGAGWGLGGSGLAAWSRVYRESGTDRRSLRLVVPGWFRGDNGRSDQGAHLWSTDLPAHQLARRLGLYVDQVGLLHELTPPVTGVQLMRTLRAGSEMDRQMRAAAEAAGQRIEPPSAAPTCEGAFSWLRRPDKDDLARPYVQLYDVRGQWLAAASSAELGFGLPEHVDRPTFDPKAPLVPGYWLVDPGDHDWPWTLPSPFDPTSRGRRGPVLATSYTLALAYELGHEVTPTEAWLWHEHGRYLEPWYQQLRDARRGLEQLRTAGDVDAGPVLDAVKLTYSGGVGRLAKRELTGSNADDPVHQAGRPWYHHVLGRARANLLRQLAAAGNGPDARWPLAVWRDTVVYAADSADPIEAAPAGLRLGSQLGAMRHVRTLPMDQVAAALTGDQPTPHALMAAAGLVHGNDRS